jgi:hypothetical protein
MKKLVLITLFGLLSAWFVFAVPEPRVGNSSSSGGISGENGNLTNATSWVSMTFRGVFNLPPNTNTALVVHMTNYASQVYVTNASLTVTFQGTAADGARGEYKIVNTADTNLIVTWPASYSHSQGAGITSIECISNSVTRIYWKVESGSNYVDVIQKDAYTLGLLNPSVGQVLKVHCVSCGPGGGMVLTNSSDLNAGANTTLNDIGDSSADGVVAMAGNRQSYTSTLDGGVSTTITNSDADLAAATWLLELVYRDNADADAGFYKYSHNAGASIAESLTSTLYALNVPSTNSSTALVAGAAGFGSTINAVGTITTSAALVGSLDGATAGTTLKFKSFIYLKGPDLVQNGGMLPNTNDVTLNTFGKVRFSNSADQASNYAEYHIQVPDDIDTAVDLRARVVFRMTAADTGTQRYVLSMDDVANSAAYAGTVGDAVNLDFSADASGASGDAQSVGFTTLTGWRSAMTAGRHWVIRIARDGNDATDASTVDSDLSVIVIEYGATQ